ncbi:DUF4302 domain-containing protein [Pseudoflavitalea rhizosphaerae]|uniref:DUF4302 domain-containing protein n=1 Tax=Pseudoflavitalea rhizosphaerae TaxID=1884793 RepID=UPI000F8CCFBA|nr:DUF4302 domain-containing protein [Pseudoflavitalea rhizosphaerae]
MKKIIIIAFIAASFAGCSKTYDGTVIPEDVPDLAALQNNYMQQLAASSEGWYLEYKPTSNPTKVSLLMKFSNAGKVSLVSDYKGFTDEQENVRFRVGGNVKPELIFETYSVMHAIAENIGGKFEFYISPNADGNFSLTQINGPVNTVYTLRKAVATDRADILAKANTALLLQEFAGNASAYFKNLELASFHAFWELNTDQQTLKLTWEDQAGTPVSKTVTYNYIANGIALSEPVTKDGISIDGLSFGTATANELEITAAGNAGAGRIAVSHTPAFPYKGTANLFMRIDNVLPRFFAYTLDDPATYYSPDLQPHVAALRELISPVQLRIQLYHYNMNSGGTTPANQLYSMQLLVKNETGGNLFIPYYTSLAKVDESHVVVTPLGTTNSVGTQYLTPVLDFMNIIFPEEGVTVVPNGRSGTLQRLRVISRKDSRIWFNIIVSTPTGIYVD